jgi:hypothetical protein
MGSNFFPWTPVAVHFFELCQLARNSPIPHLYMDAKVFQVIVQVPEKVFHCAVMRFLQHIFLHGIDFRDNKKLSVISLSNSLEEVWFLKQSKNVSVK